ncbi:hypothetical protein BC835DRAFT_1269619 [Cytidiella melzeri]|nr:hypothetical protein BC835DRAFT_1269619 [Cytidiella melzeri]
MDFTSVHALRWGAIMLFIFSCVQVYELKLKLRMLQDMQHILRPDLTVHIYRNDDHPNTLPIHVKETAMEVQWLDHEVYGLYADEDWKSLFPGGDGTSFLTLGTLPTESEKESFTSEWNQNVFAIGMYHQLHCLDALRTSYVGAKDRTLSFTANWTMFDHHVNHCLNYMRQMVLCSADTTLIHTAEIKSESMGGVTRYEAQSLGTMHRCRDWTQVRRFVEKNRELRPRALG